MIKAEGIAKLHPKNSTKVISIQASKMVWECVSTSSRPMGLEKIWEGQPTDKTFSFLKWTVYEYPENATNSVEHSFGGGAIIEDFVFSYE